MRYPKYPKIVDGIKFVWTHDNKENYSLVIVQKTDLDNIQLLGEGYTVTPNVGKWFWRTPGESGNSFTRNDAIRVVNQKILEHISYGLLDVHPRILEYIIQCIVQQQFEFLNPEDYPKPPDYKRLYTQTKYLHEAWLKLGYSDETTAARLNGLFEIMGDME